MVNVLVGCTGSVATIKLPLLVQNLLVLKPSETKIRVIATEHANHFFNEEDIPADAEIFNDSDEWAVWDKRGDPVLHIELSKWADIFVIAPLDANTLAKIANGLCDNLLTCTARAWDLSKPLIFCPAMNTKMYQHPLTAAQISTLISWGYQEVPVIEKTLICGDTGTGAMAEIDTIVAVIKGHIVT
ncbi:phosphopantothenoylcysteine decarboxylase [Asbolus verrucosus]|uniref:Phosphopantothenoylcysteine decarboxylase n=1 Tax=Asbolus verrucosus TaxID=1661398 RepID=A0A482VRC1_ASBVE|nr:phosphopantothenoylcysteine decarboxylase [Asbolus verrucosus]